MSDFEFSNEGEEQQQLEEWELNAKKEDEERIRKENEEAFLLLQKQQEKEQLELQNRQRERAVEQVQLTDEQRRRQERINRELQTQRQAANFLADSDDSQPEEKVKTANVDNIDRDYTLEDAFMAADNVNKKDSKKIATYEEFMNYGQTLGEVVSSKRVNGRADNSQLIFGVLKRIITSALQYSPVEDVQTLSRACSDFAIQKLEKERGKKIGAKTKAQKTKGNVSIGVRGQNKGVGNDYDDNYDE